MNKSSFKYWLCHWLSFQLTALLLNCWKFRFLFHDIEKPWLKLFLNYERVKTIHRNRSSHHLECSKHDYLGMIIDWECSKLTKPDATETAVEYYHSLFDLNNELELKIHNTVKFDKLLCDLKLTNKHLLYKIRVNIAITGYNNNSLGLRKGQYIHNYLFQFYKKEINECIYDCFYNDVYIKEFINELKKKINDI